VLARNLEMLAIAAAARRVHAPRARLVYECLDIHRVMCGTGPASIGLRALEGALLDACSAVLVSAPAFIKEYFQRRHRRLPPLLLVENKVLAPLAGVARPAAGARRAGAPWKIGWFGNLRCHKSLLMLREIATRARGNVEVILRGRPSPLALPDFETLTAGVPNLRYLGPYVQADLPRLYGEVHFAWSIDYTDEGLNSDWLLPNRIYEGGFFNTPSLAERRKAIGAWLAEKGAGVLLDDPVEDSLRFLESLTPDAYKVLEERTAAIDTSALAFDAAGCAELVGTLAVSERPAPSAIRPAAAGPRVAGNKS
jgi:succinoglycan biosynthesis protein ExoL